MTLLKKKKVHSTFNSATPGFWRKLKKYNLSKLTGISYHITFTCSIQSLPGLSAEVYVPCLKMKYASSGHVKYT